MTRDEATAAVTKYGSQTKAAKALGVSRRTIARAMEGNGPMKLAAPPTVQTQKKRTISERDLLIETDSETRYRTNMAAALKGLKRGEYLRDFDLRRDVGASGDASLWREVRKAPEFIGHVMEIGHGSDPAVYWGHAESVASMIARGKAHAPAWAKGVAR